MPDHYWTGKENKLPRYFKYQGDYPDQVVQSSNLERLKSSSLNDLINSNVVFEANDSHNVDPILSHRSEISASCPHIQMTLLISLSKPEKIEPKKGILKNRNIYRPKYEIVYQFRFHLKCPQFSHATGSQFPKFQNLQY